MNRKPNILVLYNFNPDWPESDLAWTRRMVRQLTGALTFTGYTARAYPIFDTLAILDQFNPRDWLIWNWVEELGGQPWTDAIIAAELEARGFAFTGSPAAVLSFSVDRMNIKQRLQELGLPTLPAQRFSQPEQAGGWDVFPAIVKGCTQHGSFGIEPEAVVYNTTQLAARIHYLRTELNSDALVEQFLDTREFHVGVLGNGRAEALLPVEYDYSAFLEESQRLFAYSYKHDETSPGYHAVKMHCPAPQDNAQWRVRLQEVAVGAFQALGIYDYGRIDLRMLGDEPQVLDVNPNCDIDFTSAFMLGAKTQGLAYHQTIQKIVEQATERMPV